MAYLTKELPSNFRFIFTCRPDCVSGNIIPIIERWSHPQGCRFLKPHQVMAQELGLGEDKMFVYKTVMTECELSGPLETAPTLLHLYEAYKRVFAEHAKGHAVSVDNLLQVLLVTCEPPPISLLQGLGLEQHLKHLPGWPTLFYESENRVYFLHKSLVDWLSSDWLHARDGLDLTVGHATLGTYLLKKEVLETTDVQLLQTSKKAGSSEMHKAYVASEYALKYAVHHLCHMGSPEMLESALKHWPYLKQVFMTNNGATLLKAIAQGVVPRIVAPRGVIAPEPDPYPFPDGDPNNRAYKGR